MEAVSWSSDSVSGSGRAMSCEGTNGNRYYYLKRHLQHPVETDPEADSWSSQLSFHSLDYLLIVELQCLFSTTGTLISWVKQ